jgi:hypothetical protein
MSDTATKILSKLSSERKFILFQGTDPDKKLEMAVTTLMTLAKASGGAYLVRLYSFDALNGLDPYPPLVREFFKPFSTKKKTRKVDKATVHLDTLKKPGILAEFDAVLVWPGELLGRYQEQAEALYKAAKSAVIVPTCNDDIDMSWTYDRALRFTLHDSDQKRHQQRFEVASHMREADYV